MTTKPRIAVVIGSTRPGRYADKAAGWILKQAQARDEIEAETSSTIHCRSSMRRGRLR